MLGRIKQWIYHTPFYISYDRYKTNKIRSLIPQTGFRSICEFDFRSYKTSDKLFVLGSGASVMELGDKQWEHVRQHNSIGFNAWVLHDFVPTYYALETSRDKAIAEEQFKHLNSKKNEYVNTPVFLQFQHLLHTGMSCEKLEVSREMVYLNAPYMPNTTNRKVLREFVQNWVRREKNFCDLFHYAASLSYIIGLGVIMGYNEIILLGIDLNNSDYFFDHPDANEMAKAYSKMNINLLKNKLKSTGSRHLTATKKFTFSYGCLPVTVLIEELKPALNANGVQLIIGNKKSALYPLLNVYEFPG